jgi:exodeoxyribonuclease VII large subunit
LQSQRGLLLQLAQRLNTAGAHALERRRWQLLDLDRRRRAALPPLQDWSRRSIQSHTRLTLAWRNRHERAAAQISALGMHLTHLDPHAVLQRGYSMVRDSSGQIVRSAGTLKPGDLADITFSQGGAETRIVRTRS